MEKAPLQVQYVPAIRSKDLLDLPLIKGVRIGQPKLTNSCVEGVICKPMTHPVSSFCKSG